MGLLFLVGVYFIPRAYDRKGFGRFVRDRLFRLGVPTLVYMRLIADAIQGRARVEALYRERLNAPSRAAGFLSANAFGVYVFQRRSS